MKPGRTLKGGGQRATSTLAIRLDTPETATGLLKTFGHVVNLLQTSDAAVRGGTSILWKATSPMCVKLERMDARQVCEILKALHIVAASDTCRNITVKRSVTSAAQVWEKVDAVTLLNAATKITRTFWTTLAHARQ
ncbi:hypothetical protein QFC20_003065 [Naganishia adeliensis]|uniref:Uncharacterized protein n=1 Tax=Naganishia adeliensis TaxID=92952 RepID=A0ACC2WGN5_9TREE|nr:hypothetical protein QFC20_003065 [Naganishia adeliensis]